MVLLVSITSGSSALLPCVTPYARSCPLPVQSQTLCRAAQDWCRDTESWRETLPTVTLVEDQADYTLVMPSDDAGSPVLYPATPLRVLSATVDDRERKASLSARGVLTLTSIPTAGDDGKDLTVKAVLQPTTGSALLPDWFVERWQRGIIARALELLYGMSGKPWAEKDGLASQHGLYMQEVGRAKRELVAQRVGGADYFTIPKL